MFLRNGLEPWHILLVVLAFIVLFGPKRLPGAAKGIAQSLKIFKTEIRSSEDEDPAETDHVAHIAEGAQVAPRATDTQEPTRAPGGPDEVR